MRCALDGIRVLELARFQAGPRAGMIPSDLGAEETRTYPPSVNRSFCSPPGSSAT